MTTNSRFIKVTTGLFSIMVFLLVSIQPTNGQSTVSADSTNNSYNNKEFRFAGRSFRMTSLTFGGNGIYLTKVNGKFSVLTGGRGSATFNDRFTLGGGGWGMTKGVPVKSEADDLYNFIKIGYGGVDFGCVFHPGKNFDTGIKLLLAGGALFRETVPESENNDFRMFPVLEPSIYSQVIISRLFRLELGAGYRFIPGVDLPYITSNDLNGFSCYIGFLVSTGACRK